MTKKPASQLPALAEQYKIQLQEWAEAQAILAKLKEAEAEARSRLAAIFFPAPVEGTNRIETGDGIEIVYNHKINRTLDVAALDTVMQSLPADSPYRTLGVLIDYKPVLVMDGFRSLESAPDQLKIFQQALTEKPGMGELKVVFPPSASAPLANSELRDEIKKTAGSIAKPAGKRGRKPGSKNKK